MAGLLLSGTAHAGGYVVRSCAASSSHRTDAWQAFGGDGANTQFGTGCADGSGGGDGEVSLASSLWFRPTFSGNTSPAGRIGGYRFAAPSGASIVAVSYVRRLRSIHAVWRVRLLTTGGLALGDDCTTGGLETQCGDPHGGSFATSAIPAGTAGIEAVVSCEQSNCGYAIGPLYDFAIAIYSSEVTIEENTPPSDTALYVTGGAGGYVGRGSRLTFSAADNLGIRKFEVLRDGQVAATIDRTCVDWSVLPCSEPAAGLSGAATASRLVGESGLFEGKQSVRVRATDGAGNTALSAPVDLTVDGFPWEAVGVKGAGVSREQDRSLEWRLSGDGAPLVGAVARVCVGNGPTPSDCGDSSIDPKGPVKISLGSDAATATVAVTFTDAVGNTSTTGPHLFTRDSTPPAAPTLTLAGSNGNARAVSVGGETGATIRAELCPATGDTCTALPGATAPGTIGASLANPGSYDLRATLTDPSGNISAPGTLRLTRNATQSELRPFSLKPTVSTNLRKRTVKLKGTVPTGSTRRITAKLSGRTTKGKLVSRKATIKVAASGKFSARLTLPKGVTTRRTIKLALTPTPATGWRATTYRKTLRK